LYLGFTSRLGISHQSDQALGCFDPNMTFERLLNLESQEPQRDKKQEIWVAEVNQKITVMDESVIENIVRYVNVEDQFKSFKDFKGPISSGFTHLIDLYKKKFSKNILIEEICNDLTGEERSSDEHLFFSQLLLEKQRDGLKRGLESSNELRI
jgi:hypothetical protein